jgi:[ribosomal protein S5]-alanine N-acetyltransferase
MYKVFSDPMAMKYIGDGSIRTRELTRGYLKKMMMCQEKLGFSLWGVVDKSTGAVIGDCGLVPISEPFESEVELGYRFQRSCSGEGFPTEAANASVEYGFSKLNLAKIVAGTNPQNFASVKILEKIGMACEGLSKYKQQDVIRFSISNVYA